MDLQPDWKEEILKKWAASSKAKAVVIKDEVRDRLAREFRGTAHYREPMKNHTSIRIGGQADVFLKPIDLEDLKAVLKIATEEDLPVMLLGAGSNTLVRDAGIRGFVITSLSLQKQEIVSQNVKHIETATYVLRLKKWETNHIVHSLRRLNHAIESGELDGK